MVYLFHAKQKGELQMSTSYAFDYTGTIQGSKKDMEKLPSVVRQIAETPGDTFLSHSVYKKVAENIAASAEKALSDGILAFEFCIDEDDSNHGVPEFVLNRLDEAMPELVIILCSSSGDSDYGSFPSSTYVSPPGKRSLKLEELDPPDIQRQDHPSFEGRKSLTCVRYPNFYKKFWSILASDFKGCDNLTHLILPNNVTKIAKTAFKDCKNLTIHTPAGSYAENYAKEHDIPLKLLPRYF